MWVLSGGLWKFRPGLALALAGLTVSLSPALAAAQPTLNANPSSGLGAGSPFSTSLEAPIQSVGLTTQVLSTRWDRTQAVLTGPVTAPAGWTPEYTVDGTTWSSTLPSDRTIWTNASVAMAWNTPRNCASGIESRPPASR